jgi:hypothetical protein
MRASKANALRHAHTKPTNAGTPYHRIVICFAIWLLFAPTPPSLDAEALVPALRSKTFQNFRLSSAAMVLGQHWYFIQVDRNSDLPAVASI